MHPAQDVFDDQDQPCSAKAKARQARKAQKELKRIGPAPKPLEAKTPRQGQFIEALRAGESVIATGGAGTGKTYIAARLAAQRLLAGAIDKIVVSRVTVSAARHANGFLPGDLGKKLEPWMIPVIDGLKAEVSAATIEKWKADGKLEIASFEHLRGRTFANAMTILDEAQNATWTDLKLWITRTGENTQTVITGDLDQIDIHDSGLADFCLMIEQHHLPVAQVRFLDEDVVRSPLTRAFVQAYSRFQRPSLRVSTR